VPRGSAAIGGTRRALELLSYSIASIKRSWIDPYGAREATEFALRSSPRRYSGCTGGTAMGTARCRLRLPAGALIFVAWMSAGCGSTAPSAPSPVSPPAPQYPSLVGEWVEASSHLVLQYRDATTPLFFNCSSKLSVQAQQGGTFSGGVAMQGGGSNSDKQCTYNFSFAALMTPDGTVTSFRPDKMFLTDDCTPVSDASVGGNASSTAIRIDVTDRATCRDLFGRLRDTDRILTITVTPR
jgi:hypothetical protein